MGFLSNFSFTVEFGCPFEEGVEYPRSNTVASRLVGFFFGVWETVCVSVRMDNLARSWNRLTLSDKEGPGCCLLDDESNEKFSIAAKFLTKRAINMEVLAKTFNPLWRTKNGFKIQSFGDHKFLFSFDSREEVDRILEGEPWTFDKHLVVMSRYESESSLQDVRFEKTKLWVQLHGIPVKFMTVEAAKKIGSVLGEVFAPTVPKIFDGGHFIRIQASIDLSLPLCRGRLISVGEGGKQVWISFKYKRLPNMCYWCGRLTHNDRDCELWINSEGTLTLEQREFGPYMRAPPFVAARRSVILVPGFYAEKKKRFSGTPGDIDSGRSSDSGRGRASEQPQGVTDSNNVSIDVEEINASLRCNEEDGIIREDSVNQKRINETITETPKETEIIEEVSNVELSLAQEFGAAKLLGTSSNVSKTLRHVTT